MKISRREFVRGGVAAYTLTFAAPSFLTDIARAQRAPSRHLVVLYLSGGNDALSMIVPYTDSFYYSRRPSLAVPPGQVLQIGSDAGGRPLGLHPRLTGLREIFNEGRLAIVQRTGYENSSRSHLQSTDIWNTANPSSPQGPGWIGTFDRVASVNEYAGTAPYPNNGFAQALRTVASSIVRGTGTRVFRVQTGGYDTHSRQGTNGGTYANLMGTLNDGLVAFYSDLRNQGLMKDTLVLQFSEFGRRIPENGSSGTDHGAAGVMMAIGGSVRGGLYGTAASLDPRPDNPALETNGADVRYETDFRAVYARVLDGWLGADSVSVLGADFRLAAPRIV